MVATNNDGEDRSYLFSRVVSGRLLDLSETWRILLTGEIVPIACISVEPPYTEDLTDSLWPESHHR